MIRSNPIGLRRPTAILLCCAGLVLGACGGGGEKTPEPLRAVPLSATASVGAWTDFTTSLPASDTDVPLVVDDVVPPVSETADPIDVA